jgi:hypothetical protein
MANEFEQLYIEVVQLAETLGQGNVFRRIPGYCFEEFVAAVVTGFGDVARLVHQRPVDRFSFVG